MADVRPWLAVLGLVALVAGACGETGASGEEGAATSVTGPPSTLSHRVVALATAPTSAPPTPITFAFGGDVHGEPPIRGVLDRGENPLASVAPLLAGADIAAVNLETTVGDAGAPEDKEFVFRAPESLLTALRGAGVDVVSLANNHSFDFGPAGFVRTLELVRASGLRPVGAGSSQSEAWAPAIFEVRGTAVALLGVARVGPSPAGRARGERAGTTDGYDVGATVAAVEAARAQAEIVVVLIHMGTELDRCPQADEGELVRRMLAAGATIVVGHHPHVLQGVTADQQTLVAYSLGNFVFYARRDEARRTGVLTVAVDPVSKAIVSWDFAPAMIDTSGRPVLLEGDARVAARAELDALTPGGARCR